MVIRSESERRRSEEQVAYLRSELDKIPAPEQENEQPAISVGPAQRIIMSPQHAKAFSIILQRNVQQWEQQFGEIQLPPEIGG